MLTGAGISVESGLPSFRGAGGLWEGWRLEDVATPEAFAREPTTAHRFYDLRRRQLQDPAIRPNAAHFALAACDLFLSVGTSGQVYPAAGFVEEIRHRGRARSIELNLEPSEVSALFDEHRHGPASEIVPRFVEDLLGDRSVL